MEKYLITMGGSEVGWSRHNDEGVFRDYQKEAERLMESAKLCGFKTIIYDNDFILNLPYYEDHKDVLTKISFGFAFKAICLYETMKKVNDGDMVFFVDSNHVIEKNPQPFIDFAIRNGAFIQDHIWVKYYNKDWGRRDTFVNMGLDEERYWNSLQMQANIVGFCKNEKTMNFVTEWKDYSLDYKVMFGENKYPNFPSFREHRHDQEIYSLLVEKYSFPYFNRTENVWGEYVIPEKDGITPTNPVDNHHRMEEDRKDNR
jgi:hypothetical protein